MTDYPLVSVVTISYNQGRFLEQAILSVLGQTYPNVEYLVMDGGSTDTSVEIIKRYADRLAYWQSAPDGGPAAALNAGFARARGMIFSYINSDDFLLPTAVEHWVRTFERQPSADIVYGDVQIVDETGLPAKVPGRWVSLFKASPPGSLRRMASGGFLIPQQASAWRRQVHAAVGGFYAENRTCWDGEFYADAALRGLRFRQIKASLASFRMHAEGITGGQKYQTQLQKDYARIARKWEAAGVKVPVSEQRLLRLWGRMLRAFRYMAEVGT